MNTDESVFVSTYVVAPEHSQVEGHKLQGDDTEDALETVHRLGQLDGLIGILNDLLVALATQDDGTTLIVRQRDIEREKQKKRAGDKSDESSIRSFA